MKLFTDCSGECCVCACGGACLAGHGDDDFLPATNEQILKRLKNGNYPNYRQMMIDELARRGVDYIAHPTEKGGGEQMKICELKIKDMASVNSITQALLLNGYAVQSAVKWKEYPQTGVDCFMIAIFDHPTEKGGVKE